MGGVPVEVWFTVLGAGWVLCALFFRLVFRGDLVPRTTVDLLQATVEKRDEQVDKLIASVDTANRMIEAVVTVSGKHPDPREGESK